MPLLAVLRQIVSPQISARRMSNGQHRDDCHPTNREDGAMAIPWAIQELIEVEREASVFSRFGTPCGILAKRLEREDETVMPSLRRIWSFFGDVVGCFIEFPFGPFGYEHLELHRSDTHPCF